MSEPFFGCIGRRLTHSYSKEIHALLAPYEYELYPIEPEAVGDFVTNPSLGGINVTIPYKREVMKYLDCIDPQADSVGAVNTVVRRDGKLFGYNTDVFGMESLIKKNGIDINNKKVLILGTGGTSLTALTASKELGAREAVRVSRTARDGAVTYEDAVRLCSDADIIINTTPVGMFPDTVGLAPVDLSAFPSLSGVVDVIYNPLRSSLVLEAEKRGIPACGGLYMLVFQAKRAAELFTGNEISDETGEEVYRKIYNSKCNIVLTGMPASGKSTVGGVLAKRLGRDFYDTDGLVEKEEGMKISEIFEKYGEKYFRDAESRVIKSLENKTGVVISTGGGSVLREENVRALKSNGKIFFLDRLLRYLIPTDTRPLASTAEAIEKRYAERHDIYLATADERISPRKTPEGTAQLILNAMNNSEVK